MTWNTSAIVPPAMWVNIMMTWQPLLTLNSSIPGIFRRVNANRYRAALGEGRIASIEETTCGCVVRDLTTGTNHACPW